MSTTSVPSPLQSTLSLSVVRRLLAKKKQAEQDLYNVCKILFKAETKIEYQINSRMYYGRVVEVIGTPSRIQVRVENLSTLKKRDIRLEDVTGIVQEN